MKLKLTGIFLLLLASSAHASNNTAGRRSWQCPTGVLSFSESGMGYLGTSSLTPNQHGLIDENGNFIKISMEKPPTLKPTQNGLVDENGIFIKVNAKSSQNSLVDENGNFIKISVESVQNIEMNITNTAGRELGTMICLPLIDDGTSV